MKLLWHRPQWNNRWFPYFEKELGQYDLTITSSYDGEELLVLSEEADLLFSVWANEVVAYWSEHFSHKKILAYMRRYEIWEDQFWQMIDWSNVDGLIFVSNFIKNSFNAVCKQNKIPIPKYQYLIPNGIDMDTFKFRPRKAGTNAIGMTASLKNVKNLPLAFQILMSLPEEYSLRQVGLITDSQVGGQILSYAYNLGLDGRFLYEGRIPPESVYRWLHDKDYLLCTSINEGNPNNIIEAMSMGIKPVIHNWPGARDQFPKELIFNTVDEAVAIMSNGSYKPQYYRDWVGDRYSLDNFKQIHNVIGEVMS